MPWNPDAQKFPYKGGGITLTYEWDNGTVLMPVTAPSPVNPVPAPTITNKLGNNVGPNLYDQSGNPIRQQSVVVQCCAPFGSLTVDFVFDRDGDFPSMPTPVRNDPNSILRKVLLKVFTPQLGNDEGTYTTEVHGHYEYDLLQPIWALDGLLPYGLPSDSAVPAAITAEYFQTLWWTPVLENTNELRPWTGPTILEAALQQNAQDPINPTYQPVSQNP